MIPILDLKVQYDALRDEIAEAINRVLESSQFVLGPDVAALEREVAAFCDCAHGVGVASGTDALRLALAALDIGPGDEVITTPFTFVATANTISHSGATPVFVDIERRHVQHRPGGCCRCGHAAHQGHRAGASLRPAGRHGCDHGHRPAA